MRWLVTFRVFYRWPENHVFDKISLRRSFFEIILIFFVELLSYEYSFPLAISERHFRCRHKAYEFMFTIYQSLQQISQS